MPAFYGKYYYNVDEKGRLIIPASFREIISTNYNNSKLYITSAYYDNCLHLYPYEEWTILEEKVRGLPRTIEEVRIYMREVIGSAMECPMDKQGRILIPAAHREDAGINGDIVIVGQLEKIEIWDRNEWNRVRAESKEKRNAVAERLATLGL